mmetsp:Transcript_22246/g.76638  ORF Transcript_22246/g.76638 Transcript_22246/m.76638 type:complete len:213 (+) Transcript_22246:32-670(+)
MRRGRGFRGGGGSQRGRGGGLSQAAAQAAPAFAFRAREKRQPSRPSTSTPSRTSRSFQGQGTRSRVSPDRGATSLRCGKSGAWSLRNVARRAACQVSTPQSVSSPGAARSRRGGSRSRNLASFTKVRSAHSATTLPASVSSRRPSQIAKSWSDAQSRPASRASSCAAPTRNGAKRMPRQPINRGARNAPWRLRPSPAFAKNAKSVARPWASS